MNKSTISLNGQDQEVTNLVPNIEGELAIVSLPVLKRLAALLPEANFHDIKAKVMNSVSNTENMPDMTAVLEDELTFHKTVNLIRTIKSDEIEPAVNLEE